VLTKRKEEIYQLYVVYEGRGGCTDLDIPVKGKKRVDFHLPEIEEKLLKQEEYLEFINHCSFDFIKTNVFDDKFLAYKRWQELLNRKVVEINSILGDIEWTEE
jgi:hypothetical protein